MPNPYIRDPKRWLALLVLLVAFVAVWVVADLIWPGKGEWIAVALVVMPSSGGSST